MRRIKSSIYINGSGIIKGTIFVKNNNLIFESLNNYSPQNDLQIPLNEIALIGKKIIANKSYLYIYLNNGQEYYLIYRKKLLKLIEKYNNNFIKDISLYKIKKNKWAISISLLVGLPIISFMLLSCFNVYQEMLLENIVRELDSLNLQVDKIDMDVETWGSYGIIEKEIKIYYNELYQYKLDYNNNSIKKVFNTYTNPYYLEENKNSLDNVIKKIEENQKKSDDALSNIIKTIDIDNTLDRIEKHNLNKYYIDYYEDLMLYGNENELIEEWEKIREENYQNFEYLKAMIDSLKEYPEYWYIENGNLYIIFNDMLYFYNELYQKIYKGSSTTSTYLDEYTI